MHETTPNSLFGEFETYKPKPLLEPLEAPVLSKCDFAKPSFGGSTYSPEHDKARLQTLLARVFDLMRDGQWRTLAEIREATGGSEASISARLRDLRKTEFGLHNVVRRRRGCPKLGIWEYSVCPR